MYATRTGAYSTCCVNEAQKGKKFSASASSRGTHTHTHTSAVQLIPTLEARIACSQPFPWLCEGLQRRSREVGAGAVSALFVA